MTSNRNPRYISIAGIGASLGLLGLLIAAPAQAREGEAEFKAHCAKCHGPRDIAYWGRQRPDAEERRAWMDKFLHKHYPPSQAARVLIVDYIETTLAN